MRFASRAAQRLRPPLAHLAPRCRPHQLVGLGGRHSPGAGAVASVPANRRSPPGPAFLEPKLSTLRDPAELPGCVAAAQRIRTAIAAGQRIVVHGDYDVDGMTATAILYLCLKTLGANVGYYVPHRIDEGFGLSCDTIRTLAADKAPWW